MRLGVLAMIVVGSMVSQSMVRGSDGCFLSFSSM